jgi:hypothetical protein
MRKQLAQLGRLEVSVAGLAVEAASQRFRLFMSTSAEESFLVKRREGIFLELLQKLISLL